MIMSNVEGVDNGHLNQPSSPAAHRFPIWWTGDTRATWNYLELGVRNAVNIGVRSLLPYISEDLGGHHDTPDPELYVRFVQFGALSPVCRLHCSYKLCRFPWMFGQDAEDITSEYIRLRYKLLPTLYSAAREAFDHGAPVVRRCDYYWPRHPEAASETQYVLGEDLLVAPIIAPATDGSVIRTVWIPPGTWLDVWSGAAHQGPRLQEVSSSLHEVPMFVRVGGMLASIPLRQHTGEAQWPELELDFFVGSDPATFTREIYEDDGVSTRYQQGHYRKTRIVYSRDAEGLQILFTSGGGTLTDMRRSIKIRIHGFTAEMAKVTAGDQTVTATSIQEISGLLPFEQLNRRGKPHAKRVLVVDLRHECLEKPLTLTIRRHQ
jgi:alpha-glucosidase (family GH31 glycosyl hydrolase)